jgi:hypothetical protein
MARAGLVLIAITGLTYGFFLGLFFGLVLPWVALRAPWMLNPDDPTPVALIGFFVVVPIIEVLGFIVMSVPLLRGLVQPRWAGVVLALAALFGIVNFLGNSGHDASVGINLLGATSPVLLAIFLAEMGRQMLMEHAADPRPVPGVSAGPMPQH